MAESMHSGDRRLFWLVGGVAAAVILVEIALTRIFSVLLFYHYSFLAVALALFGLAAGGFSASRRPFDRATIVLHLRQLLRRAAVTLLVLILVLVVASPRHESVPVAIGSAMVSAVPLFLLGKSLALAMALGRERINHFYAVDLLSSAAAALVTIPLLARVQGPMILAVPALLAIALDAFLGSRAERPLPALCTLLLGCWVGYAALRPGPLLPLRDPWAGPPVRERWNAHSRVRISEWTRDQRVLVIDKTAASVIPHVPLHSTPGARGDESQRYQDPSYQLGRPVERVAIIGVGGGPDILPALEAGAARIDGFELNGRIVELLRDGLDGYTTLARRPEVHLIHDEARHALQHQEQRYDIIRANLIDTWAATAAGGFVLAENGIYTVEAWRLFLKRLTPSGVLVTTRWYLPEEPAEAQRLVALAAAALEAENRSASRHLVAMALPAALVDPLTGHPIQTITAMASQLPFSDDEVRGLREFAARRGGKLLVAPAPGEAGSSAWAALLAPASRRAYIDASPWAIDPPTDERPFFFLQLRPRDVLRIRSVDLGFVNAITINGVRILLIAVLLGLATAIGLTIAATRGRREPGESLSAAGRTYFALLGMGYMAVQLALLQRLSLIIGHPTTTLALVIATMLCGTGLGSAIAGIRHLRMAPAWTLALPACMLAALSLGFAHLGGMDRAASLTGAAVACGVLTGITGVALGVAFPTGIRQFARTDSAVTEAWALNGAFSVLGSVLGALGGLLWGSRGLILAALPCYLVAWLLVARSSRSPSRQPWGDDAPLLRELQGERA
jgi:hypothetical protein